MLFDAPYPLKLTTAGRWVLAVWATMPVVLVILAIAAWLR